MLYNNYAKVDGMVPISNICKHYDDTGWLPHNKTLGKCKKDVTPVR